MENPYNKIDKIPGKNLLFVAVTFVVSLVLFVLCIQPVLVEISPIFAWGYGSDDVGGRRPDTPAGLALMVTIILFAYSYLRIKHKFIEPYFKRN